MAASKNNGIHWGSLMNVDAIKTPVKVIAAGNTRVPTRMIERERERDKRNHIINHIINQSTNQQILPINSIKTTNCIEQQNVPQRSFTRTSSKRLWTVELIHRRRWERRTLKLSGTMVLQMAWGTKINLRRGNVLSIRVVKYRSSPSKRRFRLWRVSVTFSLYASTISGLATMGTQWFLPPFGALMRYMQKQPGKHVTPPKMLSNALLK